MTPSATPARDVLRIGIRILRATAVLAVILAFGSCGGPRRTEVTALVLHETGGIAALAAVTFTRTEDGLVSEAQSDRTGHIRVRGLPPGVYDVLVRGTVNGSRSALVLHPGEHVDMGHLLFIDHVITKSGP